MKLMIVSVASRVPEWLNEGYNEYSRRMPRESRIELIELRPEPRRSGKAPEQILKAEAERIFAALPEGCRCIVLDERGKQQTTRQLAAHMAEWMREGRDVAFIVGGADGLHQTVKRAAHEQLSLSQLTLPHAFVRLLLAEQLYRAYTVLHNHPYHRD
jgi:23S rRNA (pseudouridine1915-N3)-methyltransferase